MIDYYNILEITDTANKDLIRKQFKKLSLKYHPDKNKDRDSSKFINIREAYDILIDDNSKQIYDYQRRFTFLKDYNLSDIDIEYLNSLYEKINNSYEFRFCKILFNTMPDIIKEKFNNLKENIFSTSYATQITVPPKYINIEGLSENYTINLNITIDDAYNGVLKKLIIHTKDYICYLFLRVFDNIVIQNGSYTFNIKFIIKNNTNTFIKKHNNLIYIKNINMYQLLFQTKYDIILPNNECITLHKTKSNIYTFKNKGFLDYTYNKGYVCVIFNLDYHKDYSKNKERIKEIFN